MNIPLSQQEFTIKLNSLRTALASQGYDGIVLSHQSNVAWLTGMRAHVNYATEIAVVSLVITMEQTFSVAASNEIRRLQEEEASNLELEWVDFPWTTPNARTGLINDLLASSCHCPTNDTISSTIMMSLRTVLNNYEQQRVRLIGQHVARALDNTCASIEPGQSEFDIASMISAELIRTSLEPVVVLVGADARAETRPHPLPTTAILNKFATISVSARGNGLVVSSTRQIAFGEVSSSVLMDFQRVSRIAAMLFAMSRPTTTFANLWNRLVEEYSLLKHDEEWMRHHQGGLAGYLPRESLLLPGSPVTLTPGNVVAFNPTIGPWKSEDTAIVTDSGVELVTQSEHYPGFYVEVDGISIWRPSVLLR